MNPNLQLLQPYPFEKLRKLKQDCVPPPHLHTINLSIGEPQHATPSLIVNTMSTALAYGLGKYPITGGQTLTKNIAHWLTRRFQLPLRSLNPNKHILPVNGTREALFAFAQCVVDTRASKPLVLIPNPFYQIYEGAARLAGGLVYQLFRANCLCYPILPLSPLRFGHVANYCIFVHQIILVAQCLT